MYETDFVTLTKFLPKKRSLTDTKRQIPVMEILSVGQVSFALADI